MELNHYEFLGLTVNATATEIKDSFTRLAFKYHPDNLPSKDRERYNYLSRKNGDHGLTVEEEVEYSKFDEKFKKLVSVYATLSDESKRKAYDGNLPENARNASPNKNYNKSSTPKKTEDLINDDLLMFDKRKDDRYDELIERIKSGSLVKVIHVYHTNKLHRDLLKKSYDQHDNYTALHFAAEAGHILIVRFLVTAADADIDATTRQHGQKFGHLAASKGHLDVVEYFLDVGFGVNDRDSDGRTMLHLASLQGCIDVVRFLLHRGAGVKAKDMNGDTAMHLAAKAGQDDIVLFYLEPILRAIDVDVENNEGRTALHHAAINGCADVVTTLFEYKADVNAADKNNIKPIHLAAGFGHKQVLRLLLDRGAKVNNLDDNGLTPLHYATDGGHLEAMKFLVERGARSCAKCFEGNTPLHRAAAKGHVSVIEYFLDNGADLEAKNYMGKTPFELAISEGQYNGAVEYLKKRKVLLRNFR